VTLAGNAVVARIADELGPGGMVATFGLVAGVLVFGLLVGRELLRLRDAPDQRFEVVDAALLPLLLAFAVAVAVRLYGLLAG
jgi:hypothetical protein